MAAPSNGILRLYREAEGCNTLVGGKAVDAGSIDTATSGEGEGAVAGSLGGEATEGPGASGDGSGVECDGSSETYDVRGEAPNQVAMPPRINSLGAIGGDSSLGSGTDSEGLLGGSTVSMIASGSFVNSGSVCWVSLGGVDVSHCAAFCEGSSWGEFVETEERLLGRYKLSSQLFRGDGVGWTVATAAAPGVDTPANDEVDCLRDGPAPPIASASSNRGFLVISGEIWGTS